MNNEGLYIRLLSDGTIKRRLVTILGEVPLEDTTIAEELIGLCDTNNVPMYQEIKEIWSHTGSWVENPIGLRGFERRLGDYLHWLRSRNLIRYTLFMTTYDDLEEKPDHRTSDGSMGIAHLLSDSMGPDHVTTNALYTLSKKQRIDLDEEHFYLKEATCVTHYLLGDSVEEEYQFRNEEQYYIFLIQKFLLSKPNLVSCQFCGRFFIPKTRKTTKYCSRIVRNNRTCKQVAPGLKKRERDAAHLVTSEYERIKDMLFHRKDRSDMDKKASVIDLTDEAYIQWLTAATDARNRYLAGELTEEEAMAIIYVPRKDELTGDNSSELTLETAAT